MPSPRLNLDDLLAKSSATVRSLNAGLLGGVGASVDRKPARALDGKAPQKRRSRPRAQAGPEVCICLVVHLGRRMDDDNLIHSLKPLRDAIACELGIDDGDARLRWEYGQVETRGQCGVMVTIQILQ